MNIFIVGNKAYVKFLFIFRKKIGTIKDGCLYIPLKHVRYIQNKGGNIVVTYRHNAEAI